MNDFKQHCIELRKQDHTLNEIARITRRPKSSVHFHIQHLGLSRTKRLAIAESNRTRARTLALRRRGLSEKKFIPFSKWNSRLVELVAHFLFDGEIKRGGCFYHNRNLALIQKVEDLMRELYRFEPKRYYNPITGVSRICYFNVALGAFFKDKSLELLRTIGRLSVEEKRAFLKSFFDDEGCMDFRPNLHLRRIRGYQKRVEILEIVRTLLRSFDIEARIQKPNEIVIVGRDNLLKFKKDIDFSAGVRINGQRSNSLWKRGLEKRTLLQKALASYM